MLLRSSWSAPSWWALDCLKECSSCVSHQLCKSDLKDCGISPPGSPRPQRFHKYWMAGCLLQIFSSPGSNPGRLTLQDSHYLSHQGSYSNSAVVNAARCCLDIVIIPRWGWPDHGICLLWDPFLLAAGQPRTFTSSGQDFLPQTSSASYSGLFDTLIRRWRWYLIQVLMYTERLEILKRLSLSFHILIWFFNPEFYVSSL